ncbi:hypothetical protein HDU83_000739 [Entophlyctis luteolus]|nr:hypothetical protein HDU83_000739 [Entophlyctis luteolus]
MPQIPTKRRRIGPASPATTDFNVSAQHQSASSSRSVAERPIPSDIAARINFAINLFCSGDLNSFSTVAKELVRRGFKDKLTEIVGVDAVLREISVTSPASSSSSSSDSSLSHPQRFRDAAAAKRQAPTPDTPNTIPANPRVSWQGNRNDTFDRTTRQNTNYSRRVTSVHSTPRIRTDGAESGRPASEAPTYLLIYEPNKMPYFCEKTVQPTKTMVTAIFRGLKLMRVKYNGDRRSKENFEEYRAFLEKGTHGCQFFSFTRSMMASRDCYMIDADLCDLIRKNSGLDNISDISKFVKYSGLLFNELDVEITELAHINVGLDPDIIHHGFNFSDGCGRVSRDIVRILLPDVFPVPSVIQIRAPGIKGVLMVDPSLPDKTIVFRKSMQKLDMLNLRERETLVIDCLHIAVLSYSKPGRSQSLNAQVLVLLMERGLTAELNIRPNNRTQIVLQKDSRYKSAMNYALADVRAAFEFLHLCGHDSRFVKLHEILNQQHYTRRSALQRFWNDLRGSHIAEISQWRRSDRQKPKYDNAFREHWVGFDRRIRIPLRESALLFGICDHRAVLKPGTCYVHVLQPCGGKVIQGRVAVMRNPCYHPGDIVLLQAVNAPELSHVHNAVVFSVHGTRPDADKCSGGDLDGDQFRVIWDDEILTAMSDAEPFDYDPQRVKNLIRETVEKLGVAVYANRPQRKRSRRDGETVSNSELINFLIDHGAHDNMIGRIDAILLEFQKFEFVQRENSILSRDELINFLTALFSAGIDAMGVDIEAMLKAVQREISNSRSSKISQFKLVHDKIMHDCDASAHFAKLQDKTTLLFSMFVDSINDDTSWADPSFCKNYALQTCPDYKEANFRVLNFGKNCENMKTFKSVLTREFIGVMQSAVPDGILMKCIKELQSLENQMSECLLGHEEFMKSEKHDYEDIEEHQRRQAKFERLFNQHNCFRTVAEKLCRMLESQKSNSIPAILDVKAILDNEVEMLKTGLPIYAFRQALVDCIEFNNVVLILSETGSGKSTCTPNFLVNELFFRGELSPSKPVIVAQPRRNATIALAEQLAKSRDTQLGQIVGAHIGKSPARHSKRTIIKCVTYGILVAYAQRDPLLRSFSIVILDEVHENAAELLFLFGIVKNAMVHNPDLKLVLMSASVDFEKIKSYFGHCEVVTVEGRSFPVEEHFEEEKLEKEPMKYVVRAVEMCRRIHKSYPATGNADILVFLATRKDIEKAMELTQWFPRDLDLYPFPLHSKMSEPRKRFVIKRGPLADWNKVDHVVQSKASKYNKVDLNVNDLNEGDEEDLDSVVELADDVFDAARIHADTSDRARRIIFSTNIAENSLTIPRIGFVVDCGLYFSVEVSPIMKIQDCKLLPTTKVSAVQRMGRAGRLGPGKCFRLYSLEEQDEFVEQTYKFPDNFDIHLLGIIEIVEDLRKFAWFKEPTDEERGWAYSMLEHLDYLRHHESGTNQVITGKGQFAVELSRHEVPATISLFLMRIWAFPSANYQLKDNCATIAAFLSARGRCVFKPTFVYENFSLNYPEYFKASNHLSSSLCKINIFRVYSAFGSLQEKEKFCNELSLDSYEMDQIFKTRFSIFEQMERNAAVLPDIMGADDIFNEMEKSWRRVDEGQFIVSQLASACFMNLGYVSSEGPSQVTFICDGKPLVASVDRREEKSFGSKASCKLVVFHSIMRTILKKSGNYSDDAMYFIGHIDPLPWAWPLGIPSTFITQYLQFFPDFPQPS